jgi:hypothetical protein
MGLEGRRAERLGLVWKRRATSNDLDRVCSAVPAAPRSNEVRNSHRFRAVLAAAGQGRRVRVPQLHEELCTAKVMVMVRPCVSVYARVRVHADAGAGQVCSPRGAACAHYLGLVAWFALAWWGPQSCSGRTTHYCA